MRVSALIFASVFPFALFLNGPAHAQQVDMGVSIGSEGFRGFYMSVGDYFRVPEREVIVIRDRGIYPDHVPVVLYLSQMARVRPDVIVDMRLGGLSWLDITVRLGLGPEIYYVPVKVVRSGPPYGKAYGYYKKHPRGDWHHIKFSDREIVDQVNLRFLSEHHGYAPERIMNMRSGGRDFVTINHEVNRSKGKGKGAKGNWEDKDNRKGYGKEKANEKEKGGPGKGKGRRKD
ncbi:MAG: hypothetical protein C4576_03370 [Desulfobacteraceae bacterium]|nr:MAG: hypothetical protein C4576_03370 [Desulfobacteraceae bacterium]